MRLRNWVLLLGVVLTMAVAGFGAKSANQKRLERLLKRAMIVDLHSDTTQLILEEGYNLGERHDYAQEDIPRMREGRLGAQFFSLNPNVRRLTALESVKRGFDELDAVRNEVRMHPQDLVFATTADDIVRARRRKKIAILIGLEGGHMIDSDPRVLRSFFELGARYMTLTHFLNTPWADSSTDEPLSNGLSPLGREIVAEMNRLGMMVDISHVSDKTFYDVLGTTQAPVIASHSSCRALCDAARNMSDDMLRALAKNGGVVHINFYAGYLDQKFWEETQRLEERRRREQAAAEALYAADPRTGGEQLREVNRKYREILPKVPLSKLLDHFDHAIRVAGIDHVGLGSDFDGVSDLLPVGMEDVSKLPALIEGLIERGYSDREIEKVLGLNSLRVMREVERVARESRNEKPFSPTTP